MNLPNIPGALKSAGSFIFGGNTGQSYEDMKRQRAMAQLMAARVASGTPQNVGQGLQAITGALVSRKLGERADKNATEGRERVQSALGTLLQGRLGATPYVAPTGAAPAAQPAANAFAGATGGLPGSLVQSESGGNWRALNSEGYGGRGQFGADRLADAARAGVIPAGMTGLSYSQAPEAVQQAVETWHVGDVMKDLGQYVGVDPDGPGPIPPMDEGSILAVAHLGGKGGAKKFIESGGAYNPSDSNGTSLADYAIKHANGGNAMAFAGGNPDLSFVSQMGGGGIDPQLMAIMNDPYVSELPEMQQGALAALFQRQLGASDPMQQLQMQKAQLELEQMRQPQAPKPIEVGGVLLDPTTYQPIFDSRQGGADNLPAEVISLQWRAEQAGLQPGTTEYEDFMRNAGRNSPGTPAAFAALDAQAKAAGLVPDTPEYRDFMLGAGAGERARATTVGKAQGEAELGLTGAAQKAELAIRNLQEIRNHPALPSITGMIQGRLPPMSQEGTDLNTRIQQAQGQAFLEAFNSLKGGGAITEIEGTKAEQAMARLNRAQSTEAYKAALDELTDILRQGVKRAYERAGQPMPAQAPAAATPAPSGAPDFSAMSDAELQEWIATYGR